MSQISNAMYDIYYIDELSQRNLYINNIHPLVKLIVTIVYITTVVSFHKYDIMGLIPFILYPVFLFNISDVPFLKSLQKLRIVLPVVCIAGLVNPFFDHEVLYYIGNFGVTGGMVSAITLIMKGALTVFASYLLISTTSIEKICYALRLIRIPEIFVTQFLLTYRYITVLLSEANHIFQAYSLRAPRQKGIHFKVWGPLVGQLLLRSMDRAGDLYDSMVIRGYKGEFYYSRQNAGRLKDYIYLAVCIGFFMAARFYNLVDIIGNIII